MHQSPALLPRQKHLLSEAAVAQGFQMQTKLPGATIQVQRLHVLRAYAQRTLTGTVSRFSNASTSGVDSAQDRLEMAIQRVTRQPRQVDPCQSSGLLIWTASWSSEVDGVLCCGQELRLQAAGRTDSGVHARGQCVSFLLPASLRMSPWQLQAGINACLPGAIRLLGVHRARPAFSARHRCRRPPAHPA
jgi:hypothetical protein